MGSYSYKKNKKSKYSKKTKSGKRNRHHKSKKTRRMRGGMSVSVVSGGEDRYINPPSMSQIAGCSSDNTTGVGSYYLNTPLATGGQRGGGQVCTQSPYTFLQKGGSKKSRKQKGGGDFWNFAKFWNPSNPSQGGNVLELSKNGTSPTGIGAPVSTAANKPIPPIQPWPAQKLIQPHDYTKGGSQVGGGKMRRGRKGKGGGILDDIQGVGRSIAHGFGSLVNGVSGYSNQVYNVNPSPTFQFPHGLGSNTNQFQYSEKNLQDVYNKSYAASASL
jgi:hypothetical protein